MRLRALTLVTFLLVAAVLGDLIGRAWEGLRPRATRHEAPLTAAPLHSTLSGRAPAPLPARSEDTLSEAVRADARQSLSAAAGTVYFDTLFTETDSTVRRWPDSAYGSLTVAIMGNGPSGWRPEMTGFVRAAMQEWQGVVPGLRFVELLDSAGSDIEVHWVPSLGGNRTGQADLLWDRAGRIHHVDVSLALLAPDGRPLSDLGLRAVAVHELGHALGLAHSPDSADVLFPATRTPDLSQRDIATVEMLYRLPAGRIK